MRTSKAPDGVGRIVVVGAGIAAARSCSAVRRRGYAGELVLVGSEPHLPYDRPPLSKAVLAGDRNSTALPFDGRSLDVRVRTATTATALDLDTRVVHTTGGDEPFDRLVIATGSGPVRIPGHGTQHVLRTLDDALAVRALLRPDARVVVVGASWIGAEVATAALTAGCTVTCLEAGPAPLAGVLGTEVGALLLPWWRDVDLRLNCPVAEIADDAVLLTDGEHVPADVVVTGVGVRPETGWLVGSGLALGNGVLVDQHLRTSDPGVAAVGDVAERWSPRWGKRLWIQHWDEASAAPSVAAAALLTEPGEHPPVHDPVPYFWSDQFGHKVQYLGSHEPADRPEIEPGDSPAVRWFDPQGRMTAWLGVDRMRELAPTRKALMNA